MSDWSNLPDEIIEEIVTRLDDLEDYMRFGGVCHSWRSVSRSQITQLKMNLGPLLMLTQKDKEGEDKHEEDDVRRFFNLSSKKTSKFYLPESRGRRCWGSHLGWVFTLGLDLNIHLLNPLTRVQISLPSQPTFQDQYEEKYKLFYDPSRLRTVFVNRFTLSWNPSTFPQNHRPLVVAVIYSQHCKLAIARPGDEAWTTVKSPREGYSGIIFFNNLIYAIDQRGMVRVCDPTASEPEAIDLVSIPRDAAGDKYLIEISGELHLVGRDWDEPYLRSSLREADDFEVYKLDLQTKKWTQLFHLGDFALFVGNNAAFSISTIDHPKLNTNSIYFTDDYYDYHEDEHSDMGVFDFEKKTVDPFYFGDDVSSSFCPPLFFIPNMW